MPATERDAIRDRIRAAGLRSTAARIAVLEVLDGATAPMSHLDMVERLGPDGWDRATLYRNLTDLSVVGLLRRVDHGDHVWRYERSEQHQGEHPHFLCTSCGEVACIPDVSMALPTSADVPRSVRDRKVQVQIQGECDNCAG